MSNRSKVVARATAFFSDVAVSPDRRMVNGPNRVLRTARLLPLLVLLGGCAARPAAVSPGEIPTLQARVEQNPSDGEALLRLSAALYADDRCEEALPLVERGRAVRPSDAIAPLVAGQCMERAGRYEDAVAEYASFVARAGNAAGADAVRSRERIARRALATETARRAIANESALGDFASDVTTVAVLPSIVAGDETYAPLSVGLAALMASDLELLNRFRIVERMQVEALLSELQLGTTERMDPATTARLGRLARANRMVQGTAEIPASGNVRLEAAVVEVGGEVRTPASETGRLQELLRLEKQVVIGIAEQLGPPLSAAERTRILNNGTQNVIAFLAYSRGLASQWTGDYAAATVHFSDAVRADPGFTEARQSEADAAADAVVADASPGDVPTVPDKVAAAVSNTRLDTTDGLGVTLANAITDVASTQAERVTEGAGDPTSNQQINQLTSIPATGATPVLVPIRVLIVIPIPIPVR